MQSSQSNRRLQEVVYSSFNTEVNALKPGNVSRYAGGHGMTIDDFTRSAELVTPILCDSGLTLGQRVLQAVEITQREVGCNTNLGMLLLFAPLVMATEKAKNCEIAVLQHSLQVSLSAIDVSDAARVFQAIRLANPGGLGNSDRYDIRAHPDTDLLTAMQAAENRDSIAKQYVTGFNDIFVTGFNCMLEFTRRWKSVEWATVACYLTFLAGITDSHIARKHGQETAEWTRRKAMTIAAQFKNNDNPDHIATPLLEFDAELKSLNINPGTSADLTAASVLVYGLTEL